MDIVSNIQLMSKRTSAGATLPTFSGIGHWLASIFRHERDPLVNRLGSAKSAGTPLTPEEQREISAAREEIRNGDFTVGEPSQKI